MKDKEKGYCKAQQGGAGSTSTRNHTDSFVCVSGCLCHHFALF